MAKDAPASVGLSPQKKHNKRKQQNMKTRTHMNFVIRSAMALTLALWFPVHDARSADAAEGTMMMPGTMMACCQAMKGQKEKMMEEMKAENAELAAQVAAMNGAPEDKKLELLAAVVTRMVEQRAAMEAHMEKMHAEMMKDMPMGKGSMPAEDAQPASTQTEQTEE